MTSPPDAGPPRAATPNGVHQFATFAVGDLYFGVEVLRVQEVLKLSADDARCR